MHILLLHGWLLGNLGDYCITVRLAAFLRSRFPEARITLVTEPLGPWRIPQELLSLVDVCMERSFREDQEDFIRCADVVIQVPGGGFQEADHPKARAPFMLRDADVCHRLGVPHIVAGHSFHPSYDLTRLRGSLVFAREPASHTLLLSLDIPSTLTADPAFLETMPQRMQNREGTTLFLRRWHFHRIAKEGNLLTMDGRSVEYHDEPLRLASSDPLRDDTVLDPLRREHDLSYERCFDLSFLLQVINGSAHVISDRYHPVLFAAMMGVPATFVQREGNLRDAGLATFLKEKSVSDLTALALSGFATLEDAIRRRPQPTR